MSLFVSIIYTLPQLTLKAFMTITSSDQKPVMGLERSQFLVFQDSMGVAVQDITQTSEPMIVMLATDTGGSMQARDKSGSHLWMQRRMRP